jgi:pyruvate dehydrogenase E2 component (dihydrolipoamide acetyltransferase)
MTEITMPRLSDSMEEGTILKWLVGDGQRVSSGQDLVEIETDKATVTYPAEADGALHIVAAEGTTLPVGAPIARIGGVAPDGVAGANAVAGANGAADANVAPAPGAAAIATPLARRVARIHEVSLAQLAGSGPRGRITRADVLAAAGIFTAAAGDAPQPPALQEAPALASERAPSGGSEAAKGASRRVQASRRQLLVARRMAEAKATIPHFQVQTEVVMDAAVALRAALKASAVEEGLPSVTDLIVKACAIALRAHPRANGSYLDGGFELHDRINVGLAVAAEEALVVAVIADADARSLGAIARETRRLAERVRSGTITPPECSGATFTVSNLGMYGMTAISPVINPPQAAILGVGSLRETLARVDGEIVDRTLMTLTLSCDHRILYGADAARLLADVRTLLEAPLALAL